jgi:hypothetical protein
MQFTFVSTMDEIIHLALLPKGPGTLADSLEPHGDVVARNSILDSSTASINQATPVGAATP